MRNLLKNKKGSALATTVLVVAVIIILTTALLTVVTYALRQSYKSSMRQQAYFTARSAAIKFRDYLAGDNWDGPDFSSLTYTGLVNGWTADVEFSKLATNGIDFETDATLGTATIRLEKVGGLQSKKWKIVSTGKFPNNDFGEVNTAVVYFIDDYQHEPINAKNRNMVVASTIQDNNNAAPQYFTSSTFLPIETYTSKNRQSITKADYSAYITANPDISEHMTHLYSKQGTTVDLQASYYSGYIISETDFALKGVGATCYGIRCLGDLNIRANGGSNLYVYGDVYVGGDINIESNTELRVYGDVYCGGNATLDNIWTYGDIYVCGTQEEDGTFTGGTYSARDGFLPQMLGNAYYVSYVRLGGDTHAGNYADYMSSGRVHQLTYAQLEDRRTRLLEVLKEDVYGKAAYVEVLDDKTDYLEGLPEVTWHTDNNANAHIITSSGYLDNNTLAQMLANGNRRSLIIDASVGEIDIYMKPGTKIGDADQNGTHASGIQIGHTVYPFGEICYYGDYPIRLYMAENSKFYLRNTYCCKVSSLDATRTYVYPTVREKDPSYTKALEADEPNFYILTDRNGVDIRVDYTNFSGYIIAPNQTTKEYQRDANGNIVLNGTDKVYQEFTGTSNTSKVYVNVGQGGSFYGSIFADNFKFIDAGTYDANSRFYFIPPSETKFTANLRNWITITDPEGNALGGGLVETPFTASPLYRQGTEFNATRTGYITSWDVGGKVYGQTRYVKLD